MPTLPIAARLGAGLLTIPVFAAGTTATASIPEGGRLDGAIIHVATTGSDANPGTAAKPLRTIQKAVDRSGPGAKILVHKGTYNQQISITHSGTARAPITLTAAGDGPVKLTSVQPATKCSSMKPTSDRTILVKGGADYWTISGLQIHNGVYINGGGGFDAFTWTDSLVDKRNWQERRRVPGTSTNDPEVSKGAIAYVESKIGRTLNPADGIQLIGNTVTGRGIHATLARSGLIQDNTITRVDCGTGPGIWVLTFSTFWRITGNDVSHIADASTNHYMQEGIRLGTSSNYNRIDNNYVHDLGDDGRGFATDVDASFNIFENNLVRDVPVGYNDEMSGWGNVWRNNRADRYTTIAFGFRMKDRELTLPSKDTSTHYSIVTNNVATNPKGSTAYGLGIGAIAGSTFSGNRLGRVVLGKYLKGYWAKQGNTWNGTTRPPSNS